VGAEFRKAIEAIRQRDVAKEAPAGGRKFALPAQPELEMLRPDLEILRPGTQ
jgi:hypothetical protein